MKHIIGRLKNTHTNPYRFKTFEKIQLINAVPVHSNQNKNIMFTFFNCKLYFYPSILGLCKFHCVKCKLLLFCFGNDNIQQDASVTEQQQTSSDAYFSYLKGSGHYWGFLKIFFSITT